MFYKGLAAFFILGFSLSAVGITRAEQEAELRRELESLGYSAKVGVTGQYAERYIELVGDAMGDVKHLKKMQCNIQFFLSREGQVEHVDMDSQNELCRKAFNAIWSVGDFPMPDDIVKADRLRQINLHLSP
ncbi:cell envelope integrity TolA C-terminal domain-containing protein [Aeromonas schubertii]|uniref:cell envelope integrity TolA C-terminal domain-containing protein n=1 Tax=Aeromonas schubertii TaxID=652 RepID=UPI0010A92BC2|nr:cell envelope integrity TolA C-terminal domain-containing protein [Aeromonas schubertii]QCG47184.1 hypothetical protein E2P79_04335 [Aeromonas schubertii]